MKHIHDSDAALRPQSLLNSDEDDVDEANSHYIVVELKDEDLKAPTEADLSIFAPVESSECEEEEDEDELSDSSGVSSWRRTNTRERVSVTYNLEDVAPPERPASFKGSRKTRQKFRNGKRPKKNPECSAANRMPRSSKEKTARHRAKVNADPVARANYLAKRRESYQKRKQEGKAKKIPVAELSKTEQKKMREKWREYQRNYRKNKRLLDNLTPSSMNTSADEQIQHLTSPEPMLCHFDVFTETVT